MTIRNKLVDGEAAEFEYSPRCKKVDDQPSWLSVSCLKTPANAPCSAYISSLTSETVPNLIISPERLRDQSSQPLSYPGGENGEKHEENDGKPVQFSDDKAVKVCNGSAEGNGKEEEKENRKEDEKENGKEGKTEMELEVKGREKDNGKETEEEFKEHEEETKDVHENEKDKESKVQIEDEKVKNTKLVRVDYISEKAEAGVHFVNNALHSNSQIRRAHCWFPCIDSATQRCPFDLEFTVSTDLVAVSNGDLLYQVLCKEDPPRKTYVCKLDTPVSAQWISWVVGPFEVLPDKNGIRVSHMCLSPTLSKLENTISFFHDVYSCYKDYLAAPFPFGLYKQIFLPSEMVVSPSSIGASPCIFSADILNDEKVIDQIIGTRIKLAYALARQWFGIYTSAEEPNDELLLDGLAGFLTDLFIKRHLGNNEARYRRFKFDVSGATALGSPAASTELYGTQTIHSLKAVAVLQTLEKQMGPDSFRKILQMIVASTRASRTLSSKEFRHLANKVGNPERPFLKELFPRWIESCGCPIM